MVDKTCVSKKAKDIATLTIGGLNAGEVCMFIIPCSTSVICRDKIAVINHEWGEDQILFMTQTRDIFLVNLSNINPWFTTTFFRVALYWGNNHGNQSSRISYKQRYICKTQIRIRPQIRVQSLRHTQIHVLPRPCSL